MQNHAVLFATLRLKRTPVHNTVVCFKLRVAHALPVHKHVLHECDISDRAAMPEINRMLAALVRRYKCRSFALDYKRDVAARLERNA